MLTSTRFDDPRPRRPRLVPGLVALGCLLAPLPALAQEICFPTPVALPGLSGPPDWKAPGTTRAELNEPRWAAAPQTGFASDPTAAEGLYRMLVDSAHTELSVSFQAPTDPDVLSGADSIYFAFTTDGTTATLAKGIKIALPGAGTDPIDATNVTTYAYDAGAATQWTTTIGAPTWLKEPAGWRSDPTAAWGINFKIDLAGAGLNPANPFKIMLAMHKRDEAEAPDGVNLWTPDPGANALLSGTLIVQTPTNWADALAINAACADGISLSGSQIGTRNVEMGNPAPTKINTTNGAVNRFYATPTIPASIPLFAGLFQAKFHVANWGSIAASNAPWTELPNGGAVQNGAAPAADNQTVEFDCPANTATQTCGIATPAEDHQCVYVELKAAPGQTVKFTRAAAYRNMDFKALSDFSAPAEISVKGLKQVLGNDKPRDVYLYVYAKNMKPHGDKPLWLPTDKMAATRRFAEAPPAPVLRPARGERRAVAADRQPGKLRQIPTPNTGIRDLDLNPHQALSTVWPTYEVHVYYDTGKVIKIDNVDTKHLAPMYPFTRFHSHEGPLYGFSHSLTALPGTQLKQLRPNVYLLKIPSEGSAKVTTRVTAHERPKAAPPGGHPSPGGPHEPKGKCNCSAPGASGGGVAGWTALVFALSAAGFRRLRRSGRGRG